MNQEKCQKMEEMYTEYLIPLRKYAAKQDIPLDDIEDLVHDTFLDYFEHYPLSWPSKLKTSILIRILMCRFIDLHRKRTHNSDFSESTFCDTESFLGNCLNPVAPDKLIIEKELYVSVWKEISNLKPQWRDIILLRIVEGLSTEETCSILGISEIVCRARLSRARKQLRKMLKEHQIIDR